MRSIWNDLLFLHGHVADVRLARRLADEAASAPQSESRVLRKDEAQRKPRLDTARIPPCGGEACC